MVPRDVGEGGEKGKGGVDDEKLPANYSSVNLLNEELRCNEEYETRTSYWSRLRYCLKILLPIVFVSFVAGIVYYVTKPDGDCIDHNGQYGTCIYVQKCPNALKAVSQRKEPVRCKNNEPGLSVCCAHEKTEPDVKKIDAELSTKAPVNENREKISQDIDKCQPIYNISSESRVSLQKCVEYQQKLVFPCKRSLVSHEGMVRVDKCNWKPESLVIAGEDAYFGEYPHMALLGYNTTDHPWKCGAVLISEWFLLTAGHCTYSTVGGKVTHVRIGILRKSEKITKHNTYRVKRIHKHKRYKPPSEYHDIALLETDRPMHLDQYAVPACLHDGSPVDDEKVVATGWGTTKYRRDLTSDILQKVELEKFSDEECMNTCLIYSRRHMERGYDNHIQVCYGDRMANRDTCSGDSGGPTQIKHPEVDCMYLVTSIISSGKWCGVRGIPGIYTRIAPHLDWIESIVWP